MKLFHFLALGVISIFGATAFAQTFFPDVSLNDWFAPYVHEIKDWGIVSGNDDGTFAPARNINRAEFSKMLVLYDERVDEKIEAALPTVVVNDLEPEPVLATSALPTVMKLESNSPSSNPFLCPEGWDEVDLQRIWNLNSDNLVRTCITAQRCEVLTLESRNINSVGACPSEWTEAAHGEINNKNSQRVCYVCE